MKEKKAPCIKKNCSFCCDPVKISRFSPNNLIPRNQDSNLLWDFKGFLSPSDVVDGVKLKAYECKNFDKKSGLCKDYEKRPNICKNTTCIDESSKETDDKQHEKFTREKFISIK